MRAFLLGMALVAGAALFPGEAIAQTGPSPNCSDDSGVDRCSAEQQRLVRELFGVPAIEELQAAGAEVRRAFYVDGYGRDLIALSFTRAAGSDPMLAVHWPGTSSSPAREPAQVLLPRPVWEEVLTGSEYFDRDLAPRASDSGGPVICMHSWVYTVEAADPARGRARPGALRRKVEDACGDGLAEAYAVDLSRIALAALPHCAALDPAQYRNEASMLHACGLLAGDRLAAAEASNQGLRINQLSNPEMAASALNVFHYRATLSWNGEQLGGDRQAAAHAWIAGLRAEPRTNLWIKSWVGEHENRVRAEGELIRPVEQPSGDPVLYRAPVTLVWTREFSRMPFQVEQATVGPFAATPRLGTR